jgi:hypothetical protein
MRREVTKATNMITVFWEVMPNRYYMDAYWRFGEMY